ncbi:UNVERIFIED_CONTAM: hypothetical protein PYX00_004885 [Menopon gallinae]|uniref:Uncharacterized protein n=1 Tax=Menopon gallinae TaxID=328185 RepID=A0AAW2I6A0_9NEOP
MAGYRRVNYYELCRLCTSSEGTKMHIFREEGRRRSLPSKIQKCLPLQVQEEDSLPKIICSTCVEKLESYYEFREACVNAEAMLESYFTSLRYSEDFTREGKVSVYVKDEPPKKKDESTSPKVKIGVNNLANMNSTSNINETNSIQPSAIQILTDAEGNRLTQYKVQVQGGIPSLVPVAGPGGLPLSVSISALTPQPVKQPQQQTTSVTTTTPSTRSTEGGTQTTESSTLPPPPPLVAAVTITQPNQELLQQLAVASKDRNMVTELLKLKNINVVDASSYESVAVGNSQIHGNVINSQMPNIIPASIRLDQLNQLINSNLQINLSQIQQQNQEEPAAENKGVISYCRSVTHTTPQNAKQQEGNPKVNEEVNGRDQKVAAANVNGSNERISNAMSGKNVNEMDKSEELNLEEDIEEVIEEQPQVAEEEKVSYECEFCSKLFKRKEHLLQHRKSHFGVRPFVCSTCEKAFSRKEHLLRHSVCHTGQKQYMCDVCRKSFSRKDNLLKHKKTHGINGPHVCETCGKSFVVRHYYALHKAQHKNAPNTENSTGATVKHLTSTNSTTNPLPFKCDLCTKSFCMKEYLTSHRMRHRCKNKKEEPEETQEPQQTSSEITVPQPTIVTSFPAASTAGNLNLSTINTQLTTINPNALLTPNIIHHSSANVVQIGNNSYLCTPNVTQDLIDHYRKLNAS